LILEKKKKKTFWPIL